MNINVRYNGESCTLTINKKNLQFSARGWQVPGWFSFDPKETYDEEIFRLRAIRVDNNFGILVFYINEHMFFSSAREYLIVRNHCKKENVPIIEPNDDYWNEMYDNLELLSGDAHEMAIKFIEYTDKSFLLKPDYYWEINDRYSMKSPEKKIISLSDKQNEIKNEKVNNFNTEFIRFANILGNNFNINKIYVLEFTWMLIEKVCIKYYSQKWANQCTDEICKNNNITDAIDSYLENNRLNKQKDDRFAMFVYYCINNSLFEVSNWYDAYFKIEKLVHVRKEVYQTQLLESKLKSLDDEDKIQKKYDINDVDIMNGSEFEKFIEEMFFKMGYSTEITKQSGDQGLDVIAEKNGIKIGIQAKCYSNAVGNSAIQETVAGKNYYNCDKVIVVTNNLFTNSAIELAQVNDVILWDRNILKEKISELF